ncbi:MAG: TIGR04211 family SH3 domain-containing protein [Gammaproteobacteria bacterium]|nr:MAG: TIGR04211 family SH3 domain-containing protein [Gammaproteobacteria bacterium]RKZ93158.1 MAG: TIGR04211 family SH3 domain-containing protein [Gammaproteobacteria bacterium]RKZ96298.1 MAG: TIGR04211 family SH3 domain-containing protein [Gammaproteobacteria bacterium]RKZ98078.1 MAG: TIGR04211 family SH3 domain-containing protein [Gammaproteobacteria bacterium]
MKKIIIALSIALPLLVSITVAAETTRFVSDQLEITMRTGQGVKFGIRKMLSSGTKLEVIETDPAGYSKVRTENGADGWVLTRYLSNTPSARNSLAASVQKVANLELEIAKYKEEIQALSSQNTDASSENLSLTETSQRLGKELDDLRRTASNSVALDNENRQLKEKLQQIDDQMQSLEIENSSLKDSSAKSWFLIGAAVLFGGLLLGLILPRLRFQKKENWGTF